MDISEIRNLIVESLPDGNDDITNVEPPPSQTCAVFTQPADEPPAAAPTTQPAPPAATGIRPTSEQDAIITAFTAGGNLVIEAGAGTGKTSTLRMLAHAATGRRGTYIAFNRAIADHARATFGPWVNCATAHSLAYRALGNRFSHRLNGPRIPARETARMLHITRTLKTPGGRLLTPAKQARIVADTLTRFCYSDATQVEPWHVPRITGLDDHDTITLLRQTILPYARRMWDDVTSPDGQMRFAHDHYLKLWQLSGPVLPADYVLLDEGQDTNPVVAAIFTAQTHAQRVIVGDRAQAIYGWRGARDAMTNFPADARLRLSRSFRFGPAIAAEANKWLTLVHTGLRLTGHDPITSTIGPVDQPAAILCRGNAECIAQVMYALADGKQVALAGRNAAADIRRLAQAAITLKAGKGTDHPELFAFKTWGELQEYVENDSEGSDLKAFVKLVDTHGPDKLIDVLDQLVPEDTADVTVSTVHRAKGLEWDTVLIADDFTEPRPAPGDDDSGTVPDETAMLAYVAVTRARHHLDRRGLAWIDKHV